MPTNAGRDREPDRGAGYQELMRLAFSGMLPPGRPIASSESRPAEPATTPGPARVPAEVAKDAADVRTPSEAGVEANPAVGTDGGTPPAEAAVSTDSERGDEPERIHAIVERIVTAVEELRGRPSAWDGSIVTMRDPDASSAARGARAIRLSDSDIGLLEEVAESSGPLVDDGSGSFSAPARLGGLVGRISAQAADLSVPRPPDQRTAGAADLVQEGAAQVWAEGQSDAVLGRAGLRDKFPESFAPQSIRAPSSNVRDVARGVVSAISEGASQELPSTVQDRVAVAQGLLDARPAEVWQRTVELMEPHVRGASDLSDRTKEQLAGELGTRMDALIENMRPADPDVESRVFDAAYSQLELTESNLKDAVLRQSAEQQVHSSQPRDARPAMDSSQASSASLGESAHRGARTTHRRPGAESAR